MADQQSDQSLNSGKIGQTTKADVPEGIHLDHAFYCTVAFKAASELRTELKIDETAFRRMAPSAWPDPRPAFIYRVLDEVQKAGLSINEWFEKLKDDSTPDPTDHETRLTHQWLLDEQNFRARKLTEVLVDLICFSVTNEPEYYRDYLRLRELDTNVRALVDQDEFFGFRRRNLECSADLEARSIVAGETKLDVAKRWYLKKPGPLQENLKTYGVEFSSFRKRYIHSLDLALPNELAALGKTYIHAYGKISGDVHFTPHDTSWKFDPDAVDLGFNRVGLLCFAILIRCQHLLGVVPEGANAKLRTLNDDETGPVAAEIVGDLKQEKAAMGDFVWGAGDICEVMQIRRSKFGYVSYLLRYLERPPISDIKEDWFAGFEIRLIATKDAAEKTLQRLQTDPSVDEKIRAYFRDVEGEKKKERLDKAVVILWRSLQQMMTPKAPSTRSSSEAKPSDAGKRDPT